MSHQFFEPPEGEEDKHPYHTPLEKKIWEILNPFEKFTQSQITASAFLLICTVSALLLASFPATTEFYKNLINTIIGFHISDFYVNKPLRFWVNDILLTLFFFIVGLEIKREFLVGELKNKKRAISVLFAAIGGMIMPACIYLLFNQGTETLRGWGIPMATDTAFALGILACFKHRLPKGIFSFMAALAIIDDIGAIIVIALFYTKNVNVHYLGLALILLGFLILLNYAGFRKPFPYITLGTIIWWLIELAGIHGTLAGIIVAFTIPARPQRGPKQFINTIKNLIEYFERRKEKFPQILADQKQHAILEEVRLAAEQASTPLQRWGRVLELPIALLVLPVFAFVNAGIPIQFRLLSEAIRHPVSLGIFAGLVLGKPIGISLFSYIAIKLKVGSLPKNTYFQHIISVALLGGIGFTMSIFMATLSFYPNYHLLFIAKTGILFGSLLSGILGAIFLMIIIKVYHTKPR